MRRGLDLGKDVWYGYDGQGKKGTLESFRSEFTANL